MLQIPAKPRSGIDRERGRVMDSDRKATHQSELGPGWQKCVLSIVEREKADDFPWIFIKSSGKYNSVLLVISVPVSWVALHTLSVGDDENLLPIYVIYLLSCETCHQHLNDWFLVIWVMSDIWVQMGINYYFGIWLLNYELAGWHILSNFNITSKLTYLPQEEGGGSRASDGK